MGEQRLKQREAQSAIYLFDEAIDLDQPLSVTFQNVRDDTWEQILTRIERERALVRARAAKRTTVIVIDTDPNQTTEDGGAWWEVGVPEVSEREAVRAARSAYVEAKKTQRV